MKYNRSVCYKIRGKKTTGQKTPWITNIKAKLDIKHNSKVGEKTLSKKTLSIIAISYNEILIRIVDLLSIWNIIVYF